MKKRITAILAFCGIFALGASAGWEQERDDAARLRSEAERSPRTTPYRLGGETIPATPELAVNIHKLDDPTAELLRKQTSKPSARPFTGIGMRKRPASMMKRN